MSTPGPAPPTLHNTLGDTVPIVTDDQGNQRAAPPNGRLVVAAGQIIASAWGNTTYDQSFMTFANAADRTNQWPVPSEGGLSFLMDTRTPWIYRQGAWRGLPLGYIAQATNSVLFDVTGLIAVVTIAFTAAAGRAYRVTARCYGTITLAGSGGYRIRVVAPAADTMFTQWTAAPIDAIVTASGATLVQATTTGTLTVQLVANMTGYVRIQAGDAFLFVEDIGG